MLHSTLKRLVIGHAMSSMLFIGLASSRLHLRSTLTRPSFTGSPAWSTTGLIVSSIAREIPWLRPRMSCQVPEPPHWLHAPAVVYHTVEWGAILGNGYESKSEYHALCANRLHGQWSFPCQEAQDYRQKYSQLCYRNSFAACRTAAYLIIPTFACFRTLFTCQ